MKVTKNQLKQLISEEIKNVLSESRYSYFVKGDPEDHHGYGGAPGPEPRAADSTDKADGDQTKKMVSVDKKDFDEIRSLAKQIETELSPELKRTMRDVDVQKMATKIFKIIDGYKKY